MGSLGDRFRLCHEGEDIIMGQWEPAVSLCLVRIQQEDRLGREISAELNMLATWSRISSFPNCEKCFYCLSHPVYSVLLGQPELIHTIIQEVGQNRCEVQERDWGKVMASLMAQRIKHLPVMQETRVRSLGWEDPLEKEMATHSSILAWRIPWIEEPGGLQSTGSQRVGHDWETSHTHICFISIYADNKILSGRNFFVWSSKVTYTLTTVWRTPNAYSFLSLKLGYFKIKNIYT